MLSYFRDVIALRRTYPALRSGEFHQLLAQGQQYAFAHSDASDTLLVVCNMSETAAEISVPVSPALARRAAGGRRLRAESAGHSGSRPRATGRPARTGLVCRATVVPVVTAC